MILASKKTPSPIFLIRRSRNREIAYYAAYLFAYLIVHYSCYKKIIMQE